MLKENFLQRLQSSSIPLLIIKSVFIIWCIIALGVFEQEKAEMARKFNDHFMVYSIFWMILSGLAYLLTLFFRAKNLNDISNTIGIVATYLLLPITFILFLLVMVLLIIEGTFDIGLLTIVSAFPMIYVGILFWKSLQNKFTLLEM